MKKLGILAGFSLLAAAGVVGAAASVAAPSPNGLPCLDCTIERVAQCGGFLEGPNFDGHGTLWTVDYRTGNILAVKDGKCRVAGTTGGAANGARFGPDGRLYIADAKRGLLIFDPDHQTVTVWIDMLEGAPMVGANDLVFDRAGNLYATVRGTASYLTPTGRVILVPRGSATPVVLARDLRFPNGIAVKPDGSQLFVGLFSEKAILAINLDPGTHQPQLSYLFVRTEGGVGPDGMMIDEEGRLLWADFGNRTITIADGQAQIVGKVRLPEAAGNKVTNIARYDGAYYVTEAERGEIWRIPMKRGDR